MEYVGRTAVLYVGCAFFGTGCLLLMVKSPGDYSHFIRHSDRTSLDSIDRDPLAFMYLDTYDVYRNVLLGGCQDARKISTSRFTRIGLVVSPFMASATAVIAADLFTPVRIFQPMVSFSRKRLA